LLLPPGEQKQGAIPPFPRLIWTCIVNVVGDVNDCGDVVGAGRCVLHVNHRLAAHSVLLIYNKLINK